MLLPCVIGKLGGAPICRRAARKIRPVDRFVHNTLKVYVLTNRTIQPFFLNGKKGAVGPRDHHAVSVCVCVCVFCVFVVCVLCVCVCVCVVCVCVCVVCVCVFCVVCVCFVCVCVFVVCLSVGVPV